MVAASGGARMGALHQRQNDPKKAGRTSALAKRRAENVHPGEWSIDWRANGYSIYCGDAED